MSSCEVRRQRIAELLSRTGLLSIHVDPAGGLSGWELIDLVLIVADWDLPGGAVMTLCRRRAAGDAPPLLVTGRDFELTDRILALELGADDLFDFTSDEREFTARVRALVRRSPPAPPPTSGLTACRSRREVSGSRGRVRLSQGSWDALVALYLARDGIARAEDIVPEGGTTCARMVMSRLRRKLVEAGESDPIMTLRGGGYGLNCRLMITP